MRKVLYACGLGACPEVTLYECGFGPCPKVTEKEGTVVIEHPGEPGKGRVEMSPTEWNTLLREAKPVEIKS